MKYSSFLVLLSFLFFAEVNSAQKPVAPNNPVSVDITTVEVRTDHRTGVPNTNPSILGVSGFVPGTALPFQKPAALKNLDFVMDPSSGLPTWVKGIIPSSSRAISTEDRITEYLTAIQSQIQIENPGTEFEIKKINTDPQGIKHLRLQQYYQGIKVYGGEMILHEKDADIFMMNGRYFPTPTLESLSPTLTSDELPAILQADLPQWQSLNEEQLFLLPHAQIKSELVIYHLDKNTQAEQLVWHVTAFPNVAERWEYFINAHNGEIIYKFTNICQFHARTEGTPHQCTHSNEHTNESNAPAADLDVLGPTTATATDLQGINRTINVYEEAGTYYMIDASRTMFSASLSSFPNNPSGVVWSIDAFDTSPENDNFTYDHLVSGNNTWNNPTAVSAHYNGGIAYEYFKNTFGRESINGQGGNIVSIINVSEGSGDDMDNAFWNGQAMFYGNGDQVFNAPLAKALDVAGHEMSHGVIQSEANLEYQYESGALNESFADIFGAMIDRDDWDIGEEVANPSIFPTGTMRSMSDPNNGGNSSDFYWQPKHVNEQYTGSQDNGGVHINSGIPNYAYYLFATSVGKETAEEVFYDVLTNYLVASSQFVDLRYAVVQACTQTYGANSNQVAAANSAFDAVGISGSGGGNDYQEDIEVNPGEDFVLWSDLELSTINNALTNGTFDGTFSNTNHISKPSLTDDGSIILFIDEAGDMIEIDIDWSTGQILDEYTIEGSGIWRNVATSKDGSKLAAITNEYDNRIFVFDFISGNSQWFDLYNPTTAQGISTGDIQYPDVLEWDASGEFVMYDALNELAGQSTTIEYWDIGFVKVWDNASNNFGDGFVSKLFSGLPDNVSVGNPTFSKNSSYIIAFDYIESTFFGTDYAVLGANIQTGEQGTIFTNNKLGYPSYSTDDQNIIFSLTNSGQEIIGLRALSSDKISGEGDAFIFLEDATWGVWFATGSRDLTASEEITAQSKLFSVSPNPASSYLQVERLQPGSQEIDFRIVDLRGRLVSAGTISEQNANLNLSEFASGTYFLQLVSEEGIFVQKFIKQ